MALPNLFSTEITPDPEDPEGFRGNNVNISELLGASELVVKLIEVQPGNHVCPYHYEYVEEWLVVLAGPVLVRTPEETRTLASGEVMRFGTGPAGAHQVSSPPGAQAPARVLMFSRDADPAVCVYPDSDKLAVYERSGVDEVFVRRSDPSSHLDYYDGETP